jgi:uncharacterized SAM-binding protein YcdF (DUF218 family)
MFFFLSKVLSFLLSPLVWTFALLLSSFMVKQAVTARRLRLSALIVFYITSNSFVVDECFRHWEPVTKDHDSSATRYEAAIILGGIGNIDLRLQKINFGHSADRLFQALPLYYSGKVRKLIFTGGSGSLEFPEKREAIYVRKYLRSIQFPDSALLIESDSRNTYENAVFLKKKLDSLGSKGPYLLVTSAFHMPRAMAVFRKAGYSRLDPFITNKVSGVRRFTPDHLLIPNTGAMFGLETLLHEMLGYAVYRIRGYA